MTYPMNDKIKNLLASAEKTDAIAKNKWRIENREQLREQRKKELKELMEKDKNSMDWLISQLQRSKDWHRVLNDVSQMSSAKIDIVEQAKEMYKRETTITENTSDGFHTFKLLYDIRKAYNVALFNEWGKFDIPSYNVHKSRKHHDGEYPFGKDNWFIVCAELPNGQISNHYPIEDWDLFQIPETEKALFPFDGHTTEDVIERLLNLKRL